MNGDGRMILLDGEVDMESETMDEHMAALVLTSLSCSPTSPVFVNGTNEYQGVLIRYYVVIVLTICSMDASL